MKRRTKRPIIAVLNDWGSVADIFSDLGAYTLDVEYTHEVTEALYAADAVVFTGGGDINPVMYGWDEGERHARVYGVSDTRDVMEFAAFAQARKRNIPMLGICRGAQLINVGSGGTLHQDIFDGAGDHLLPHSNTDHSVKMRRQSRIGRHLGNAVLKMVTSLHHQAVDRLGDGLVPVGWAPDGTVEMIETAPGVRPYMLGTQFHPEIDTNSTIAEYSAHHIFEFIFDMAKQHSISRGGDYYARLESVDHLLAENKLIQSFASKVYGKAQAISTPSKLSVNAYLDNVAGHGGSEDYTVNPDDEEDTYEAWLARNDMYSERRRRDITDIDRADAMCVLDTGCQCPLDCLSYGDCAADTVNRQTIKEVINEMSDDVRKGKRGHRR